MIREGLYRLTGLVGTMLWSAAVVGGITIAVIRSNRRSRREEA